MKKILLNNPNRDYFDLKELVASGHLKLETPLGGVRPVYRLDLDIQATDNNADLASGLQSKKNPETIKLKIISEGDLIAAMNEDVQNLAKLLNEAMMLLTAASKKYEFVSSANASGVPNRESVDNVKVAAQDAMGSVEKARDKVLTVRDAFIRLTRECEVNRINESHTTSIRKLRDDLTDLLAKEPQTLDPVADPQSFAKVLHWMKDVQVVLVANPPQWAASLSVSNAQISLTNLMAKLGKITLDTMQRVTKDQLRELLRGIKNRQLEISTALKVIEDEERKRRLVKAVELGRLGVQTFMKGESKKLTHTIDWRQYPEQKVKIAVKASDDSISVPAELVLDFEKDELRFSYDVKVGGKAGQFKITLTPTVGEPVEVIITVN